MGREINERRIKELEADIVRATGDITQLKRARNSLLNISVRVPPEILGYIFYWRVQERRLLGKIKQSSYQFLLVCHHWYLVASRTPELWSFWGHMLNHWFCRYKRSGATPVDLVLNGYNVRRGIASIEGPLQVALRKHAEFDILRSIQLWNERKSILAGVLAALTPGEDRVRVLSIETLSLRVVDASKFVASYRFPKLSYLRLWTGTKISDWDRVGVHTTALTTLALRFENHGIPSLPDVDRLLTLLDLNPLLRNVTFSVLWTDPFHTSKTTHQVSMHNLQRLTIDGVSHSISQLVSRLDYPHKMEEMTLTVAKCNVQDILGTLGRLARDYIVREARNRAQVGVQLQCRPDSISLLVNALPMSATQSERQTFAILTGMLEGEIAHNEYVEFCTNLVACAPVEEIVYFGGEMSMEVAKRLIPEMRNLKELYLFHAQLEEGFLQPERRTTRMSFLPSLKLVRLEGVFSDQGCWRPLLQFLARATEGGQKVSLSILGPHDHICRDVLQEMMGCLDKLTRDWTVNDVCPFDVCSSSGDGEDD